MILAINCLQLIGTAEILSGKIRENMDLAINCMAIIEVKQCSRLWKKQALELLLLLLLLYIFNYDVDAKRPL